MSDPLVLLLRRRTAPQYYSVAEHVVNIDDMLRHLETQPGRIEIASPEEARALTSAELLLGRRVNSNSCNEIWTSGDGTRHKIGDMEHGHLVHALALVMRTLREKGGSWKLNQHGALRHYATPEGPRRYFPPREAFYP